MLKVSYGLYLFVLIFSPLAFGTVDVWAEAVVETACALSFCFYLMTVLRRTQPFYRIPALLPFLLFLFWNLAQLIPLPVAFVDLISPTAVQIYKDALGPELPGWLPITVSPFFTLSELLRFSSYLLVYILTIQLLSDRKRLKKTVTIVVVLGTLIAVQAILQSLSASNTIYWFRESTKSVLIFGPFFYKNHFAGYAEMLLPVSLSLFLYFRPRISYSQPLRQKVAAAFNQPTMNLQILFGFASSVLIIALMLSRSRGGVICAAAATLFMLMVWRKKLHASNLVPLVLLVLLVALLGIGKIGLQTVDQRFGQALVEDGSTLAGRTIFWRNAIGIVRDFPLTGSGFGTFSEVYPSYKSYYSPSFLKNCHNDYLENLTDGGIIAVLLVATFLLVVLRKTYPLFRQRRDRYAIHLFVGSITGAIALLLHSFAEYQFNQAAAIGLYFFFLVGLMVCTSHIRCHGNRQTLLSQVALTPIKWSACLLATAAFVLTSISFQSGRLLAGAVLPMNVKMSEKMNRNYLLKIKNDSQRIIALSPLHYKGYWYLALAEEFLGHQEDADAAFQDALRVAPSNSALLLRYALLASRHGKPIQTEQLFKAAIKRDKSSPSHYPMYAYWLLGQKRAEDAKVLIRQELELDPARTKKEIDNFEMMHYPLELLRQSLPDRVRPHLAFASHLAKNKQNSQAADAYLQALRFLNNEERVDKSFFTRPYNFFRNQKEDAQALAVLMEGVKFLPEESILYLYLGDVYKRQGMFRLAEESFQKSLTLNPGDAKVKKRLAALATQKLY